MLRQSVLLIASAALLQGTVRGQGVAPAQPPKSWTVRVVTNCMPDGAEMSVDVTSRGKVEARRTPAPHGTTSKPWDVPARMPDATHLGGHTAPLLDDLDTVPADPVAAWHEIRRPGAHVALRHAAMPEAEITEAKAADVYRATVALLQKFTLASDDAGPPDGTFLSVRLTIGKMSIEVSRSRRGNASTDGLGAPDVADPLPAMLASPPKATGEPGRWLDRDYPEVRRILSLVDLDNMDLGDGGQLPPIDIGTAAKQE